MYLCLSTTNSLNLLYSRYLGVHFALQLLKFSSLALHYFNDNCIGIELINEEKL